MQEVKNLKNLRQAMDNKEDLLDSLIDEVRGMADFAKTWSKAPFPTTFR